MKDTIPQRARLSSRKKIKKSLGPDFLDPSKLGLHVSAKNSNDARCDRCNNPPLMNGKKDLITCKRCSLKVHVSCMQSYAELKYKKNNWLCLKCRQYSHFGETTYEREQLIFCDICNEPYHIDCASLPIDFKAGKRICADCQTHKIPIKKATITKRASSIEEILDDNCKKVCSEILNPENKEEAKATIVEENLSQLSGSKSNQGEDQEILINSENFKSLDKSSTDSSVSSLNVEDDQNAQTNDPSKEPNKKLPDNGIKSSTEVESNEKELTNDLLKDSNGTERLKLKLFEKACKVADLLPANTSDWSIDDVENFIKFIGFTEEAKLFREQDIDGKSLLLLARSDVLTGFSIKLGPALKIYAHISRLQIKRR